MKKNIIKGFNKNERIDIEVSSLIMGASDFLRKDNMAVAKPLLDEYIALGGNAFDTARHYRHGEMGIAAWLEQSDVKREDIIIFTKCCHPVREHPDTPRVSAAAIEEDIKTSLEMLQTDYVDLFALHRDDERVDVKEIMEALNRQIDLGRVHAIGVSNWRLERIIEANEYAQAHGLKPLTFTSPNLSLAKPMKPRWPGCVSADEAMVKWHQENKMPLISWSSQAGGFFSGRFTKDDLSDQEMVECFYNDANWTRYDRCIELAQAKAVTPIQVALAYVINQPFTTFAAIGPERIEEMRSSVAGATMVLSEKEIAYLDLKSEVLK